MSLLKKLSKLEWCLFLYLFLAFAFFYNEYPGWNVSTRMNLIYSIVDMGRLSVDYYRTQPGYETDDIAYYNGHYYCDKSPILSFMGVPAYWAWAQGRDLLGLKVDPLEGKYPVALTTVCLFGALLGVLLFRILKHIRPNPEEQLSLVLFYSLGTTAMPYSFLFLSHQAAALFAFGSFCLAFYVLNNREKIARDWYHGGLLVSGFLSGLAMATEQPTGIIMIALAAYVFYRMPDKKEMAWYIPGIIAGLMLPMPYNYACFGSPFSSGYKYEVHPVFKTEMSKGLMGVTLPHLDAFWGITFSQFRGLFFMSPFLLFAFPGFYSLWKSGKYKIESLMCLFIIAGFILFNSSYYAWWGGWGIGPRHMVPMLPFLIVGAYALLPRLKKYLYLAGIYSVIIMVIVCITEPQVPDSYLLPLTEFTFPRLMDGVFTRSILSDYGLSRGLAVFLYVLYLIGGAGVLYYLARKESKTVPQD
jgi:hypothetical protein